MPKQPVPKQSLGGLQGLLQMMDMFFEDALTTLQIKLTLISFLINLGAAAIHHL